MVVHHADDGHTQIAADTKGYTEAKTREDGDDVAAWHAKAGAVHDGQLLLLHQLRTPLCRQLDCLAIGLTFLQQPYRGRTGMKRIARSCVLDHIHGTHRGKDSEDNLCHQANRDVLDEKTTRNVSG